MVHGSVGSAARGPSEFTPLRDDFLVMDQSTNGATSPSGRL